MMLARDSIVLSMSIGVLVLQPSYISAQRAKTMSNFELTILLDRSILREGGTVLVLPRTVQEGQGSHAETGQWVVTVTNPFSIVRFDRIAGMNYV